MTPTIDQSGNGIRVVWPESIYRYLMSDGSVIDLISARDDSEVRGLVLTLVDKGVTIMGVACVGPAPKSKKKEKK